MKASGTLREYKVVGRCLPTPKCHTPPLYRMRIFAPIHVVAKSRFWYFVLQLKKMKNSSGEIVYYPGDPDALSGLCSFLFSLISTTLMFQYYFNHFLVSQLRTPVSVLPGNPPQELAAAAAENVVGTGDTLGCSVRQSFYV
uniref:60S ribosomal protein L18a-like n=1 Tax=Peromyscus maniculatus bairdii TaxID=230844 RepID=A0A8C8UK25_PERMB